MALVRVVEGGGPMWWCPACACAHGGFNGWTLVQVDLPTITPSYLVKWSREDGTRVVCHAVVADGKVHYCSDSSHHLSGQTVDMVDF